MSTTASLEPKTRKALQNLAKSGEFKLADLVRIYLEHYKNRDLNEITINGMPVIEEVELLAMKEEGSDGIVYNSVEDLIKDLNDESEET